MLDFGWTELVLIMALAVLVIGPSEIPALMVGLGRLVRRITYVKYAFSQQFEEFMKQADMDDIAKSVNFETIRHEKAAQFDEAAADEDEDYHTPEELPLDDLQDVHGDETLISSNTPPNAEDKIT